MLNSSVNVSKQEKNVVEALHWEILVIGYNFFQICEESSVGGILPA
jgi:hypothetical protein